MTTETRPKRRGRPPGPRREFGALDRIDPRFDVYELGSEPDTETLRSYEKHHIQAAMRVRLALHWHRAQLRAVQTLLRSAGQEPACESSDALPTSTDGRTGALAAMKGYE